MFLAATGSIHTLYALIVQGKIWIAVFRDGAVGAIGTNAERSYALWFLVCGILVVLWGATLHCYIRQTRRPAPALLSVSVAGCVFEPLSGFWLFLPQALLMIAAGRRAVVREAK